jgi:hypothetical protein
MGHRRYRDYVPPMPSEDARRLRGLAPSWQRPIDESEVDGLQKRAGALALALRRAGRRRDADELSHRLALLERADELQRHASNLETLVGLYRALAVFAHEDELDDSHVWAQTGALAEEAGDAHGPAFRELTGLRNRAFRLLSSAVATYSRELAQRALG